jgi:hypothetical protein
MFEYRVLRRIMRSFITCAFLQDEMGRACSTNGGEEEWI